MEIARIVVPIIIAVIVLSFFGGKEEAKKEPLKGSSVDLEELSESYFPLVRECSWEYEVEGVFEKGKGVNKTVFSRAVIKERADESFQLQDSRAGRVVDTYYMARGLKGIEITTMSLDKRKTLFLPLSFGPGSVWNLTSRVRATADDSFEELEVAGLGEKKCIRVRFERFYDKDQTPRPDWYFEGYRWFCQGVGIVKVDLRDVQEPRINGRVDIKETWEVRTLKKFKVPVKK